MPTTSIRDGFTRVSNGSRNSAGTPEEGQERLRETVRSLLGGNVRLSEQFASGDIGLYSGAPHTTTGLAYALHGRATVVSMNIASKLASFEDPIKSIMPVAIHNSKFAPVERV